MEIVETQNQNHHYGSPLRQSRLFEFVKWERNYGAVEMPNGFAKFAPILNGPSTNSQLFAGPALNPVLCRFQSGVFCVLIA
jgi:hypothetical protein